MGPEPSRKVLERDGCCHHRLKTDRAPVSGFKGNVQSRSLLRPRPGRPSLQRDLVPLSLKHPSSATGRERGVAAVSSARRGAVAVAGEGRGLRRRGPFPAAPGRPPARWGNGAGPGCAGRGRPRWRRRSPAPPRWAGNAAEGSAMEAAGGEERVLLTQVPRGCRPLLLPGPTAPAPLLPCRSWPPGTLGGARPGQDGAAVWAVGQRVINVVLRGVLGSANGRLCCVLLSSLDGLRKRELTCHCFGSFQRLKAAVHYTVGCLCQDVAENKEVQFSKQTIAAIAEITFRQCGTKFAYYLFV